MFVLFLRLSSELFEIICEILFFGVELVMINEWIIGWIHWWGSTSFDILSSAEIEFSSSFFFKLPHDFHQIRGHVIWSSNSVVNFTIFAEAHENCIKSHLINSHEAVNDEESKDSHKKDRDDWRADRVVFLKRVGIE